MAKKICNKQEHLDIDPCIIACKFAKYCGPYELDYECTCDKDCVEYNQFDEPVSTKIKDKYKREQTIKQVVPIVMDFFNELFIDYEGCHFYNPDPQYGEEDRKELYDKIMQRIRKSASLRAVRS